MNKINVFSEYGILKTVLVHRPGKELENLTPQNLERLLFDDIPFLDIAVKEHDEFTEIMRKEGIEVLYIEDLVAEALDIVYPKTKSNFINQFITEAKIKDQERDLVFTFLIAKNNLELVKQMIAGIRSDELNLTTNNKQIFLAEPLPNILFQRDPFASVGNNVTIHHMWSETRNRETLFSDFLFKFHPRFKKNVEYLYRRNNINSIEGGDILVLNSKNLIIGVSQRTELKAIEMLSKNLFNQKNNTFERVVALELPKSRAFMHLDTVFTNIDRNKFIVHPLIFEHLDEFKIHTMTNKEKKFSKINKELIAYLSELIGQEAVLIKCGDSDISAAREQWNDGTNVLAIAPRVVIAYDRNPATIKKLEALGVKVYQIPSSELSRGRGGPRCMAIPLVREKLKY